MIGPQIPYRTYYGIMAGARGILTHEQRRIVRAYRIQEDAKERRYEEERRLAERHRGYDFVDEPEDDGDWRWTEYYAVHHETGQRVWLTSISRFGTPTHAELCRALDKELDK